MDRHPLETLLAAFSDIKLGIDGIEQFELEWELASADNSDIWHVSMHMLLSSTCT